MMHIWRATAVLAVPAARWITSKADADMTVLRTFRYAPHSYLRFSGHGKLACPLHTFSSHKCRCAALTSMFELSMAGLGVLGGGLKAGS